MDYADMATWTVGWRRDTAHLFVDAETAVALCGNKVPRAKGRRMLIDPSLTTYVYLNDEAFCHPCVRAIQKRLGRNRIDDVGLHYGDAYGWSDDPKDIAILSGPVDRRRDRSHHYRPLFEPQADYVEEYYSPTGVTYVWTLCYRAPILYLASEIVTFDMESDAKWRATLKAARAAGLGDSFSGHSPSFVTSLGLERLEKIMASQMKTTLWLSTNMPTFYM